MDKNQLALVEQTLITNYGKEKAYKMLHSNIPEDPFVRSLAWANFEFFVRYFLLPLDTDPCRMAEHYFKNMPVGK